MYSNYICNYAWFAVENYNPKIIINYIEEYNNLKYCG